MWEVILPFCRPLLPRLLGHFDLGLNSEQQQSRNKWDGWILIPKEVRKQELYHLLKTEKQDILSSPSASSVIPNASRTQSCFSHQHWRAFQIWVSLLSSLSVLPQKVWTTNKEDTRVPHAGTCTDPFLLPSPSTGMCGFTAPLQLSKDNHYRADYFLRGCDRGVCEILLVCKYQLKIKKENHALTSPSGIHFRYCWIMPKCK